MKLRLAIFLTIFGVMLRGHATVPRNTAATADSVCAQTWPGIVAGGVMTGSAAAMRWGYPRQAYVMKGSEGPDRGADIAQYLPIALPWIMKAAGTDTRSGWGRMAVSQGLGLALTAVTAEGLKRSVESIRPDGTDKRSFPSGHTAIAFMGATMVARELTHKSAWYPMGAYTLATGIAIERVIDKHHYPTDVVAGAGIGILATEIGYLLGDLIFGNRQLEIKGEDLRPNNNFSYLSIDCGLSLPLGKIYAGGMEIERMPALSASMRGAWGAGDHWGLAVELGLLSMPVNVDVNHDRTYVKSLSSLGLAVLPYYYCTLSQRVSINAEAGVGYRYNFPLNVLDDAVKSRCGTPFGRIAAGCVLRLSPHFSARASVGYEIARYKFSLSPSQSFHIPVAASASGISSALLFSIASRYEF